MDEDRKESGYLSVVGNSENESESTAAGAVNTADFSDKHSLLAIKVGLVSATVVILLFSVAALVALWRTKFIPKTACLLSSSLLWFDCATSFTFALRNIVTDSNTLNVITLVGIGWATVSFVNVALMALDRFILFQWPYLYMRRFTNGSCVIVYYLIIITYLSVFTGHWINCFVDNPGFWDIRKCMVPLITIYMTISQALSVIICVPCLLWIVVIIKKQQQKERSRRERNPTIVVFVCCLNFIICTIGVFVLLYTEAQVTIVARRTATDIIHLINCLVDSSVYVLWFKECRYELLKMVAVLLPPVRHMTERLKNEVHSQTHSAGSGVTTVG